MLLTIAFASKNLLSAAITVRKVMKLEDVLNRYYQGWTPFTDEKNEKQIVSVQTALAYAVSQKQTKAVRKSARAAAIVGFGAVGAIAGGALGTVVVPGALTAAGAMIGGQILSEVPRVGIGLYRGAKYLYKWGYGSLGVHRKQAATVLYYAYTVSEASKKSDERVSKDFWASYHALEYILRGQSESFLVDTTADEDDAIAIIAARLTSW